TRPDREVDRVDGPEAAERDGDGAGGEDRRAWLLRALTARRRRSGRRATRTPFCGCLDCGSLGGPLLLLLLPLLHVPGARDPLRVDEQRDDQREAADEQRPVSGETEPLVEGVREQALGGADAGDDRPRDHGDAAEVGECDQAERRQGTEAAIADRAEVV